MYVPNPSDGKTVVVSVGDATLWPNLYYTVGVVDQESATTDWGNRTQYGRGQQPSICLVKIIGDLYAIGCHCSDLLKECDYRWGKCPLKSLLSGVNRNSLAAERNLRSLLTIAR